jgi:hypothetical protein
MPEFSAEIDADIRYEVILMGPSVPIWKDSLTVELKRAFEVRMLDPDLFLGIRTSQEFSDDQDGDYCVGVWMGALDATPEDSDLQTLNWMLVNQVPVFPVVDKFEDYQRKVPAALHAINGMTWESSRLTAELLAAFKLVGKIRRAFVSYRRTDSTGVAVQIFEELSRKGYEVFLDTASVPAGSHFQQALWNRMSNADLVVFLDSPNALDSTWVHQEIGRANAHGLGLLQIVWPGHTASQGTGFCDQVLLASDDFLGLVNHVDSRLSPTCIESILKSAERCRIKSLAGRRRCLSDTANMIAEKLQLELAIHPVLPYRVTRNGTTLASLIPHIGIPDARSIQEHESDCIDPQTGTLSSDIQNVVLFDGLGMDPSSARHLQWLNERNPIQVLTALELEQWIAGL